MKIKAKSRSILKKPSNKMWEQQCQFFDYFFDYQLLGLWQEVERKSWNVAFWHSKFHAIENKCQIFVEYTSSLHRHYHPYKYRIREQLWATSFVTKLVGRCTWFARSRVQLSVGGPRVAFFTTCPSSKISFIKYKLYGKSIYIPRHVKISLCSFCWISPIRGVMSVTTYILQLLKLLE